jgi:hypothetical protein
MDKINDPFIILEKIIEVFSLNKDLRTDKNLEEIISDLKKIKSKIDKYLSSQQKFEN